MDYNKELYEEKITNLIGMIQKMKRASVDQEFTSYLIAMEQTVGKREYPAEYYEGELNKNYQKYLSKNPSAENIFEKKPKKTFEFHLGACVLGLVGVIFILMGLVTFAMNYMNDFTIGILFYVAAIAVVVPTEVFLRKKQATLSGILTGIGVAAMYIATIVNYYYWKNFNEMIATIIVIAISGLALFVGTYRQSVVFKSICLIGGYICLYPYGQLEDELSYIAVCSMVFLIHMSSIFIPTRKKDSAFHILGIISNLIFSAFILSEIYGSEHIEYAFYIQLALAMIVFVLHILKAKEFKQISKDVLLIIGVLIYYMFFMTKFQEQCGNESWICCSFIIGVFVIGHIAGRFQCVRVLPIVSTLILANTYYTVLYDYPVFAFLYAGVALIALFFIKKWYPFYIAMYSLIIALLPVAYGDFFEEMLVEWFQYILIEGVILALYLLYNHLYKEKTDSLVVINWVYIVILAALQLRIAMYDSLMYFICTLLIGCTVIFVLCQEKYIGKFDLKYLLFSLYLCIMMLLIPEMSYVTKDILMAVTALVIVVFGFIWNRKSVRICGLLYALLLCGKIAISDLVYITQAQKMFLYFGAGIAILLIAWLYVFLEKKLQQKELYEDGQYDERRQQNEISQACTIGAGYGNENGSRPGHQQTGEND